MKRRNFIKLFMILLSILFTTMTLTKDVEAKTGVYCSNDRNFHYCVVSTNRKLDIRPIYETQAQHRYGYQTQLSLTTSNTQTKSFSGSLSFTFETGFILTKSKVSVGVNVTYSQSNTVSSGIAYTIDSSKATGKYRIIHVFPYYDLRFESYTLDGELKTSSPIRSGVPGANESYKDLQKYE